MHILWYTGVELPAVTGKGLTRAGWQEGLRRALHQYYPQLKLSIASFGTRTYQPIQSENATYYNIYREPQSGNRWTRLLENWRHRVFTEEDLERSWEIYEAVQPDMVFIFGTENPFGLLADRFSVPAAISIQAVLNGLVQKTFAGLRFLELVEQLFSRTTLVGQGIYHKWWLRKRLARTEREIYERVRYFEGRTEWDRAWLARLNPNARYFHIDRVLGEDYYRAEWSLEGSQENRIFSLCGNAPFKGGITLVRAAALLKRRGRPAIQLRLAGVDQDSMAGKYIQRNITRNGLEGQVELLGRLNTAQIIAEMRSARLFVLPSHMDNSPNSLAQAMILGMPCIASNAGGIPSMLDAEVEGSLYPHQDITALADRIESLLGDPGLSKNFGRSARTAARLRHDPKIIARKTYSLYQEVLEAEGRA